MKKFTGGLGASGADTNIAGTKLRIMGIDGICPAGEKLTPCLESNKTMNLAIPLKWYQTIDLTIDNFHTELAKLRKTNRKKWDDIVIGKFHIEDDEETIKQNNGE